MIDIRIERTTAPKAKPDDATLGFGKHFSDHMFIMDYEMGKGWGNARIVPFGRISLHPASTVLHYGSEIFEGLKAYRTESGEIRLFRPMENIKRMNNFNTTPIFFKSAKVRFPLRLAATIRFALFTPTPGMRSSVS